MNITKKVTEYINSDRMTRKAIASGIISYSRLARRILKESNLGINHFDAALVAIRRYPIPSPVHEQRLGEVLRKTTLTLVTDITRVVLDRNTPSQTILMVQTAIKKRTGSMHIIEGEHGIVIIMSDEFLPLIKQSLKQYVVNCKSGLVEIILKSPKEIEQVPGVVAHIYSLFNESGINIIEELSCWTDTILLIEKKDTAKAMDLFNHSITSSSPSSSSASFLSSSGSASS